MATPRSTPYALAQQPEVAQCATRPGRLADREQLRYFHVSELTELITKVAQCATSPIEQRARFHEPYLMRLGLIAIVRGGRVAA